MEWNEQQKGVFAEVRDGHGHAVVLARAGTGKTTTILGAFDQLRLPPGKKALFVAFNASIAKELSHRAAGKPVEVSTLHSYGLRQLRYQIKNKRMEVDGDKVSKLLIEKYGEPTTPSDRIVNRAAKKLTSRAKCRPRTLKSTSDLDALAESIGVYGDLESTWEEAMVIERTKYALSASKTELDTIDFDDMVWLPVVLDIRCWQFPHVFVDETQDLNPVQIELVKKAAGPRGRITAVGDDKQAIYLFRGADSNSISGLVQELGAKVLPLNKTYRCGRKIVAEAQVLVPDFFADDANPEGAVRNITGDDALVMEAKPGNFVISRTNAPLMRLWIRFVQEGIPARIEGRDLGQGMIAMMRNSKATTVEEFEAWLTRWKDKQVSRRRKKNSDDECNEIYERVECMQVLCSGCATIEAAITRATKMFETPARDSVVLTSTHKAKGLESSRCYVLRSTYLRFNSSEERNLLYVAITRAKDELVYVHDDAEG